jgi:hypothetical protein
MTSLADSTSSLAPVGRMDDFPALAVSLSKMCKSKKALISYQLTLQFSSKPSLIIPISTRLHEAASNEKARYVTSIMQ